MCDPNQIAQLKLANTGLKAGSGIMQARYESALLNRNADLAREQAVDAMKAGAAESSAIREEGRQAAGTQAAVMGANGVDPGSSRSAMALLEDTAYLAELDASTATENAGRTARALQAEAANNKSARRNLKLLAPIEVGTGILSGGTRAWGTYRKLMG